MEEAPSIPSPETAAGLAGAAGGVSAKPLDPDGSLTVEQVSDPPPLVVPGDADGSLTVEQVSDPPPRVAKVEPLDPHGSMTVDQVSEDPPDACPDEPPVLSVTSRVPVSIDASAPRPRRPRANPSMRLDPTEAALDLPPAPPRAKPSRGLPPYAVALFGGLFGLAAIASVLAVLIQVDGPNRGLPEAADSASGSSSARAGTPNRERAPSPSVAPGSASETPSPAAAATASAEPEPPPGPWRVAALASDDGVKMVTGKLGTRSLMDALEEEHVQKPQIFRILKSFEDPKVFDKPRKSHTYAVAIDRASKRVRAFEYQSSPTDIWQAKETEEGRLVGQKLDMKVEQHRVAKAIVVKDDLKAAVVEAGFDDDLLDTLDDALEDRISLSRLGRGCMLRVIAQEQTVFGRFARYVDIEAVEFWTPRSEKPTRVYHYRAGKTSGYFDENGKAPYKGGWRAPLKFPRVTSRFNPKRLHPVLHTVMPHNGTDFGAPSGTPVYAASHGTVSHVGPHGPSGNLVLVEHAGGIETGYAHLSKFAPGIKKGDKVETRQLVGFVGSTGRSTGPHLHFSVKKNGQFVDPLTALKMDGERVLPPSERDAFGVFKAELDKVLDALPLPDRGGTAAPPADDDDDKDSHGEESESPPGGHAPAPAAPNNAPAPPPATAPEPAKNEDDSPVWKPQALLPPSTMGGPDLWSDERADAHAREGRRRRLRRRRRACVSRAPDASVRTCVARRSGHEQRREHVARGARDGGHPGSVRVADASRHTSTHPATDRASGPRPSLPFYARSRGLFGGPILASAGLRGVFMRTRAILPALCLLAGVVAACGGGSSTEDGLPADEGGSTGGSGTAGKSGAAGAVAGKAGSAGATAGAAGTSGAAGTAGTGGNAGAAAGAAGSAGGKAGTGGAAAGAGGAAAGTGGAAAGTGGAAAGAGGAAAGAAGKGGAAGSSGTAGAGGAAAGTGGAAGAAGATAGAGGATAGAGGAAGKGGSAAGAGGSTAGAAGSAGSGGTPIVVDCKTTADCATNPLTKLCDTATSKCVVCLTTPSDTCGANQYCNAGVCVSGCKTDGDCSGTTPHCDTATHVCKECLNDPQCKAGNICSTAGTCAPGCSAQQPCTDPNASCCGTTCQNTKTDPANCGGCNKPCTPFPNAQTLCNNGTCAMGTCAAGFADCDGNPANGCEVNTALQGACVCKPGVDTKACYYGPAGTQNKGICKGGNVKCAPDGLSYEFDCFGQVLPEQETCTDGIDHDCNGVANDVPDVDGDGWNVCNGDCCETIAQCGNPKAVNPGAVDVVGDPFPDANCNNVSDPMGGSCSTAAKFTGVTGTDMAKAMELCQFTTANPPIAQKTWGVINATQLLADGSTPNAAALANIQNYQAAILINYGTGGVVPRKNATMVGMSSGRMRDQSDPDYVAPNGGTTFTTQVNPPAAYLAAHGGALPSSAGCSGNCPSGSGAYDSVMLRLDIRTPTNAKSFSYDLRFFSSEYWTYQCTSFNDFFLTQLTTGAAGIPADKNISFDNKGNAISVNNGFFESCVVKGCNTCPAGTGALAGTGLQAGNTGGGTTWLTTTAPILPGETMRLDLAIFDVSDHILDSLILMDNFQWSTVAVGGPSTGHSP